MQASVKVTGLQDAFDQLHTLVAKVQKAILRKAMNKAGSIVLKEMKKHAPVEVGRDELSRARAKTLKKSLGKKVKSYAKKGVVIVVVGPRRGFRKQVGVRKRGNNVGQPVYYDPSKTSHLVEKGTSHAAAKPFARPARDNTEQKVFDAIVQTIQEGLEQEKGR